MQGLYVHPYRVDVNFTYWTFRAGSGIELLFRSEDVGSWAGCFVVVNQRKIRVFRPAS